MGKTQILAAAFVLSAGAGGVAFSELVRARTELGARTSQVKALEAELADLKAKRAEAERALKDAGTELRIAREKIEAAESASPSDEPAPAHEEKAPPRAEKPETSYRVSARISAIEKFVPLSDDQRRRLDEKFRRDIGGTGEAGEGLEEILGKENADYYRAEMRRAFDNAELEEREREVFYLSRKLGLSAEQEGRLGAALDEAEAAVKERRANAPSTANMQDRIKLILEENKLRQKILGEQLQKIFSAEQYKQYVEQHVDSSEGNFPVWHESE